MGLVTLLFVVAFAALYLSRSLANKPELLVRVTDKINTHIDRLAVWGAAYGLACFFLTLLIRYTTVDMLIRLVANAMIVVMALPFIFDKLTAKYQEKVNPAIMDEARHFVAWISKQEKNIGYAGAACGVLLFVILFR